MSYNSIEERQTLIAPISTLNQASDIIEDHIDGWYFIYYFCCYFSLLLLLFKIFIKFI